MKIKFAVLVLGLFLLKVAAFAQTPTWQWANSITPIQGSVRYGKINHDAFGNIYATGFGTTTSGGIMFGNTSLPLKGMLLAKYTSNGKLVWAKPISETLVPFAFHTDSKGNSYITGRFSDTATIGTTNLICKGKFDLFVTKLDSMGNVIWANRGGGPGRASGFPPPIQDEDEGTAIGADSLGNVYVGGLYYRRYGTTATFDTLSLPAPAASAINGSYGFLAKYTPGGTIMWLKTLDYDRVPQNISKLAVSPAGNFYISGDFQNTINFGPGTLTLNSAGINDAFLAAFDPNGTLRWARRFGGSDMDFGHKLAINHLEECYISGTFYSPNFTIGTVNLTGAGQSSGTIYLAKYSNSGNFMWAQQTTGGSIGDVDITLDAAGNPCVTASFTGTVTVGQQIISASNITIGSAAVIKWNASGVPVWAVTPQGMGSSLQIIGSSTNNDLYLTGAFRGTNSFGNHTVTAPQQQSGVFIAKLNSQPTGIRETIASKLSLYPNPAQRELHLNLPKAQGTINAQLSDATGKIILTRNLPAAAETMLTLPELPQGIYLLTIQTEKQVYRQKVVIQ